MNINSKAIVKGAKGLARTAKFTLAKRFPEILSGLAIGGFATSVVTAVKATPKAMQLIEEEKERQGVEKLSVPDTIKATWKCYIVPATSGAAAIACVIAANTVHNKRNAALAAAYALSESSLQEYKDSIKKVLGVEDEQKTDENGEPVKSKADEVTDDFIKKELDKHPYTQQNQVNIGYGQYLYYDIYSGRYYPCNRDMFETALNEGNRMMLTDGSLGYNDWACLLSMDSCQLGEDFSWYLDGRSNLLDVEFRSNILPDGTPVVVPIYNFDPVNRYLYDLR